MINLKQEELIDEFVEYIQKKFPEVQLVNVTPSPENPNDLWINVTYPENEDRQIELMEYSSEKGTDILLDYGYYMLIMPADNSHTNSAKLQSEPAPIAGS